MADIKKYKFLWLGAGILIALTLFLFLRSEKKVQFQNIQKVETTEDNNISAGNVDLENTPENNSPADNNTSLVAEGNNSVQDEKSKTEEKNKSEDLSGSTKIVNKLVGWGYQNANGRKIDAIVIHSTYNATGGDEFDLDKILNIYKSYGVAPHYIIDRAGGIYRLVLDQNIAYHAGEAKMPDGRTGVNNFSIGIEIITSKTDKPTDAQYGSLRYLISYLKGKYAIKYTVGHSQIAPGRKDDPWNFDWNRIK